MKAASIFGVCFIALAGPAAAQSSAEIAIECTGQWYKGDPFGESEAGRKQVRRYILDERQNKVSYWNEDKEIAYPFCDRTYEECEMAFYPTEITARHQLNSSGSALLRIGRRSGLLEHYMFTKGYPTSYFMGECEKTEMPTANSERNIF